MTEKVKYNEKASMFKMLSAGTKLGFADSSPKYTTPYQHQFVKTPFPRIWSKMSYGYFWNPWDLPHLVHRPLWP